LYVNIPLFHQNRLFQTTLLILTLCYGRHSVKLVCLN